MNSGALQDPFGLTGVVLEGQYRADAVVGEGGFGVVYRGRHLSLDQPIAIKVLKGLDGGDPRINALVLEKFRAEARLLYTLSQSSLHIVRALDFGASTMPSGAWAPFMILEWLEGCSLEQDLDERRRRGAKGRSLEETLAILEPVADGLGVAHGQNVAHRDVKPANVFLLGGGRQGLPLVKVLDFGIAKIMKEGESAGTKGTFASFTWLYAAPEQLDPRIGPTGLTTDVYGFGLLMTELLTDRKPVAEVDVIGIMRAAVHPTQRPTPRTRGAIVPDAFEAICQRALAVDPRQRFASIHELWAALVTFRDGRSQHTLATSSARMRGAAPSAVGAHAPVAHGAATGVSGFAPTNFAAGPLQEATARPATAEPTAALAARPSEAMIASPPIGTHPPGTAPPPYPVGPPLGTAPPPYPVGPPLGTAPPGYPTALPYPQHSILAPYPASPPLGTAPPGRSLRRVPFVRADGTSPVVIVTIVFFILTVLLAGSCALVHGACNAAT